MAFSCAGFNDESHVMEAAGGVGGVGEVMSPRRRLPADMGVTVGAENGKASGERTRDEVTGEADK